MSDSYHFTFHSRYKLTRFHRRAQELIQRMRGPAHGAANSGAQQLLPADLDASADRAADPAGIRSSDVAANDIERMERREVRSASRQPIHLGATATRGVPWLTSSNRQHAKQGAMKAPRTSLLPGFLRISKSNNTQGPGMENKDDESHNRSFSESLEDPLDDTGMVMSGYINRLAMERTEVPTPAPTRTFATVREGSLEDEEINDVPVTEGTLASTLTGAVAAASLFPPMSPESTSSSSSSSPASKVLSKASASTRPATFSTEPKDGGSRAGNCDEGEPFPPGRRLGRSSSDPVTLSTRTKPWENGVDVRFSLDLGAQSNASRDSDGSSRVSGSSQGRPAEKPSKRTSARTLLRSSMRQGNWTPFRSSNQYWGKNIGYFLWVVVFVTIVTIHNVTALRYAYNRTE